MKRFLLGASAALCAMSLVVGCSDSEDGGDGDGDTTSDSGDGTTSGDGDTTSGDGDGTSTSTSGDGDPENVIEVFSWWVGPGEAEALQALIDLHEDLHPEARVTRPGIDNADDLEAEFMRRVEEDEALPDLYQENVHDIPQALKDFPDRFAQLDDLFDEEGWKESFLPEVMDEITIDGHIYTMPTGVHRENALIYNSGILGSYDIEPPTTLDELFAACDVLKADGVTCIATGYQGWILRIMFHSVAMGTMGGAEYRDYFSGEGDVDDPALSEAIDNFETILKNYIHDDFKEDGFGWQEASQAVFDGDAAFFYHGDWAAGYVQQLGWEAGSDYGSIGAPGASEVFLFGVDTFTMPTDAGNPEGAIEFLKTLGSSDGQAAFNNIKGSTPVRLDTDKDKLTPVAKAGLEDLRSAEVVMRTPSWENVDDEILAFATDFDKDALVEFFKTSIYGN